MHKDVRNIAIIAHVDHGKTTLVDRLLQSTQAISQKDQARERVMDSNALEQERGITILAKVTAIDHADVRINIVDTPGHADFGGEVERILSMVDSVLLLVDAVDGPMPQTRFVTQKAFARGLKPIVVVNKIDRPGARPHWVMDQVFDLFVRLGASDAQLDFPMMFTSALQGYATEDPDQPGNSLAPLLDLIVRVVPKPDVDPQGPFQMQISALDYSTYVGTIGIGRIHRGRVATNTPVVVLDREGNKRQGRILQVFSTLGLERIQVPEAHAGDIVAICGVDPIYISDTLCAPELPEALPALKVDEPTMAITLQVNQSPFAGKEGSFVTSRQIRERLLKELIHNVALRVTEGEDPDKFLVSGRGELHLSILLETMRREGYEFAVSRPIIMTQEIEGVVQEPYEQLILDVETEHQGAVMEMLGQRRGELRDMQISTQDRVRLEYIIPSRFLFGFRSEFLSATSGTGLMHHVLDHYAPLKKGETVGRSQGVLISNAAGKATGYALFQLQDRGRMFVSPQTEVYEGMIVGIHNRDNDLVVNVIREKQLTNIRASGSDENIILTPPILMSLEQSLEFIEEDELLEVTPLSLRLRKKFLKEHERKRAGRS